MRYLLTVGVLVLTLFCGTAFSFMLGRVEGNSVHYSTGKSYTVDSTFIYIGTFQDQYDTKEFGSLKTAPHILNYEVFGKKYNDTNELIEIFIASWDKLPSGWTYHPRGPLDEKLYSFKVTRFNGLAQFLTNKGYTFSSEFFGGIMRGFNERNVSTTYMFVVANSVMPTEIDKSEYVKTRFASIIKERSDL